MYIDSDQVTLEPEAGEQLRTTLAARIDQVDGWLAHLNTLAQRAPLGANPVGEAMAAKFELRAHGDPLSFVSILTAYRDVLGQTLDAVTKRSTRSSRSTPTPATSSPALAGPCDRGGPRADHRPELGRQVPP